MSSYEEDSFPNYIERECDKCRKEKITRYYHGGNEDTFDFYLCRKCEHSFFNNYLGIALDNSEEEDQEQQSYGGFF